MGSAELVRVFEFRPGKKVRRRAWRRWFCYSCVEPYWRRGEFHDPVVVPKADLAGCSRVICGTVLGMSRLQSNEEANKLIVAHEFAWCRARLFHALAGAHEQGILGEVLRELFDDTVFAEHSNELAEVAGHVVDRWKPQK